MNAKFDELREKYPVFTYEGYEYAVDNGDLHLVFHFSIGEEITFAPKMVLSAGEHTPDWNSFDIKQLEGIVFHIGMIELISYWKCTCSPTILVKPWSLTEDQQWWWLKVLGRIVIFARLSIEVLLKLHNALHKRRVHAGFKFRGIFISVHFEISL